MVHLDKDEFDNKCKEIMRDVKKGEATSSAWVWMVCGAALGFISSCLKLKRKEIETSYKAEAKSKTYGYPRG